MGSLPWDMLLDILVRLPLKSIVRFRCVDRLWRDELKGTKFLRAHRRFASDMDKFNLMFYRRNKIDTFRYDPSLFTCEGNSHFEYPMKFFEKGIEVLGCCDGLILLRRVYTYNKYVLVLWNPTTNECKRILKPPPATGDEKRECEEYALGYSARIEDFKVVHLTFEEEFFEVHVYTLKSNSWRRVDNNLDIDYLSPFGVFDVVRQPLGGAAHWLAEVESIHEGRCIARFDFETEEFDVTVFPEFKTDRPVDFCALGGSLCIFVHGLEVTTIWELKQNGMEKLWNKLITIEPTKLFASVLEIMPLKSNRDGKIVLGLSFYEHYRIVLYDPEHKTVKTLKAHEFTVPPDPDHIVVYEESLHSLNTGTPLTQLQWEDEDAAGGDLRRI